MPRRKVIAKREVKLDPLYQDQVITKFVNNIMLDGKKSKAQKIVYSALKTFKASLKQESASVLELLQQALRNVMPPVEVRSRRVGGATYQVPVEVKPDRALKLAMDSLKQAAKSQPGNSFSEKLAKELVAAFKNTGAAVKAKENRVKMAEANQAFVTYRWND